MCEAHFISRDLKMEKQRCITTYHSGHVELMPISCTITAVHEPYSSDRAFAPEFRGHLPFLEKRIESIVFLNPEHALHRMPNDEQTLSSIGGFVDSYVFALGKYLAWCEPTEKALRHQAAWEHATQKLRGMRMSPLESRAYWKKALIRAGAQLSERMLDWPFYSMPKLPGHNVKQMAKLEKWHPGPNVKVPGVQPRELDLLVVDYIEHDTAERSKPKQPRLEGFSFGDFWDIRRQGLRGQSTPGAAREAFIAFALLWMDGPTQAGSGLLDQPFPVANPRFPAVYLDEEVLGNS